MIEEESRERELIRQIVQGNRVAMKRFYDDHSGYLTAVCARYIPNKEDVRDVLQESYLKIFNAIHKFEYKGSGSLRAWSTRIVVNEALNHIRAKEKMQFTDLPDEDLPDPVDEGDRLAPAYHGKQFSIPVAQSQRHINERDRVVPVKKETR